MKGANRLPKLISPTALAALVLGEALAGGLLASSAPAGEPAPSRRGGPVLPFAEDEQEAGGARRAPVKIQATPREGSNFKPRFKTPAIRRAQHTEPAESESPAAEATKPADRPADATPSVNAAETQSTRSGARDAEQPQSRVKRETRLEDGQSLEGGPALDGDAEGDEAKPAPATADPSNPRTLLESAFQKSKTAAKEEDYGEIIDLCRKARALELKPPYEEYCHKLMAWAHNRRGEVRATAKHDAEALADFDAAVALNPNAWRAVHNRGVSYAAQGKTTEALADFDRTIQLNDRYPNAFFNRGQLRYGQRDFKGAVDDYTAALNLAPPDASLLNNRGHAFYRMDRFGEALRDYAAALKLDPQYAPALVNRGDAYCDLGRYGEAAKDYQEAVKSNPKSGRAYQAAAWLMATCPDQHYRNDKLALEAARRALALDGDDDYRALETLAAAQANSGDFAEAKKTQEQAIANAPRGELALAEKRLGMYQRDLAYRENPRPDFAKPEEEEEKHAVRRAAAIEKIQKQQQGQRADKRGGQRPSYPFAR